MSTNSDGQEVRMSYMLKRSLGKSSFTKENYKNRFFVLYPTCLKYYDGSIDKGRGKEKGRIDLKLIKTVAPVADGELNKHSNAFQVVYEESGESYTLYVVADGEGMKNAWIASLREECDKLGVRLTRSYHPGVWSKKKGSFSCCNQMLRTVEGCKKDPSMSGDDIPNGLRALTVRPPGDNPSSKVELRVAMNDYKARGTTDLDLVRGDEYKILNSSREVWWLVEDKHGRSGYVPANHLRDVNSLEAYAWYFRNISRPRCEALLKEKGKDGTFLVRDSVQKPGSYTLSVFSYEGDIRSEGCVKHYHIRRTDSGGYYIAKTHIFDTIPAVIEYHKVNGAGLVTRLKNIPNQSAPTVALGSDKWEISRDDLKILDELGRGQFGCVRKGLLHGTTEVAIKMMNPNAMSEDDFIEEAKTMTQLQHPNLVQLYGVCTVKPIYIVVEYMAHGALQTYLKRNSRAFYQKVPQLVDICVQICGAMEYLEEKNIIHRDLAARNCLVGKKNVVKVCDFGLARFVSDDEYTSSSGTKFPVRWSPPEVINFSKFSSKSDVWAYGVLMWEVFSLGQMPYGKIRNHEVANLVESGRTCDRPDICPADVYKIMKRCWAMQPEKRPNFNNVLRALEGIMERDYQE